MMIKKNRTSPFIALLLLAALTFGAFTQTSAQTPQRERRVTTQPVATPTPTPTPKPIPQVAATPDASAARQIVNAPKTVEELRARIQEVLRNPELDPAQMAVKVASLDTNRTLFEVNTGKLLHPASNMKIYTWAAALDRLSPDFRFKTSAYAAAPPDASGTIHGDLIIYGRGDPTFAASLNGGDYTKAIDDFAARILAANVKRIEGNIVGDESYFTGPRIGYGWEWEDLQWEDGAEISALTVNDNALDLFVNPGAAVGAPAIVTTGPVTPFVTIVNRVTTGQSGTKRDLTVIRPLGTNTIEVSGSVPVGLQAPNNGRVGSVAITNPALLFVYLLRSSLAAKGVIITGQSQTIDARARAFPQVGDAPIIHIIPPINSLVEITNVQSQPLSVIAAETLKPSQNLYTELVLRALGKFVSPNGSTPEHTTADDGIEAVKTFLRAAGIEPRNQVVQRDGSGLTRHDYITASATLQLLTYMNTHRYAAAFRDALPIAGVDGTLRTRLRGTPAAGNLRAKTGTINGVASLSGYVTSAAGEHLVFSIILNNYPEEATARRTYIDNIAVLLASFAGHS
jgi:D-alanyl-D-alanine carboxypeptidase/D-alanyl-D-alanine-endopeptidase (penicillin-binding protein 4)